MNVTSVGSAYFREKAIPEVSAEKPQDIDFNLPGNSILSFPVKFLPIPKSVKIFQAKYMPMLVDIIWIVEPDGFCHSARFSWQNLTTSYSPLSANLWFVFAITSISIGLSLSYSSGSLINTALYPTVLIREAQ